MSRSFLTIGVEASPVDPSRPENPLRNPRVWNDRSGRGALGWRGIDDVGYIRAVLNEVGRRHPIDRSRIFATGFSSGASMTWRLGVELADQLAAIAPVAGMWAESGSPAHLPSALYITGTEDPLNPLRGGMVRSPWGGTFIKPPAGDNPARWAHTLGCAQATERRLAPGVIADAWQSCAYDAEVLYITVEGLGHHWPGGVPTALPAGLVGLPNDAVDATSLTSSSSSAIISHNNPHRDSDPAESAVTTRLRPCRPHCREPRLDWDREDEHRPTQQSTVSISPRL